MHGQNISIKMPSEKELNVDPEEKLGTTPEASLEQVESGPLQMPRGASALQPDKSRVENAEDTMETDVIADQNEGGTPKNKATHSSLATCQCDVPKESSETDVISNQNKDMTHENKTTYQGSA